MTGTCVAAAINGLAALASFVLAARTPAVSISSDAAAGVVHGAWPVYITIALSGFTALGAEVVWTRLLGLMLGATVYAFSLILAASKKKHRH